MASRERKRAERQKRKARSSERRAEMSVRSEAKNEAAREALEPLSQGERPVVVTVAALISMAIAVMSIAGFALWSVLRDDPRPNAFSVASFVLVIGAMAYGLWNVRYWAVLGFQAALVLVVIAAGLGTISGLTLGLVLGNLVIFVIAGTLFYFMIKAMARIQMPERASRD